MKRIALAVAAAFITIAAPAAFAQANPVKPVRIINPLAAGPEVHHYIKDSGAETVIVLAAFAKAPIEVLKASQANKDTPLRNVIAFQIPSVTSEVESGPGIHDFNDIGARRRTPNPTPTSAAPMC